MLTKHYPKIIDAVNFNLNFISETKLKTAFKRHFRMYSYLLPCKQDNTEMIQDIADLQREKYNALYDTMRYEYNPLENYRMIETEKTDGNGTNNRNEVFDGVNNQIPTEWKTTVKNGGYGDGDAMAETSETEQTGVYENKTDNVLTVNGGDSIHTQRTLTRAGNIGITTSQQMIQSERDLLISILDLYFNEFAECFRIEL